ncbi:MAG: glutamine--fructose-6-phosphate aminotransferase [Spirochaetes bacterium RBG_16_67_19]|nr:MAG: glutamine--fructose-6-phosphate aminotransferase [Spirochaetes bacterium RBG_16_67_19]
MCGIIGYCGPKPAAGLLLEGLKRLEYRGYDSAGICVQAEGGGPLSLYKRKGKIRELIPLVPEELAGSCGIGHTRWATHGEVTDQNAHPHLDCSGRIAVAHNGIIENYLSLREKLASEGHRFASETDSEVIAHLIEKYYSGDLMEAVRRALALLKGTYGIVCLHRDHPDRLVGARQGSPLVVGIGHGESFLASDVTAIIGHTKQVVYLEDGELVCLTPEELRTTDLKDQEIQKKVEPVSWELEQIEKGGFAHFMEKEIFEQPESIKRAMGGRIDLEQATAHLGGLNMSNRDLLNVERVRIVAAGTSWHAGLVGMYLLESIARIPCTVEIASELRYRNPVVERNTLHFVVSQSGETIDSLYAMRELQRKGATVLGICNVVGSTIPRESNGGVYIHSGPEIAVASTKAFTSQITVFYLFSLLLGRMRDLSADAGSAFIRDLASIPAKVEAILAGSRGIRELARRYCHYQHFLFLGRGINYPVAMEGALKLKEISYIHAEGYSASELKHGPIALIGEETPCLFLVPDDGLRDKLLSNIKEVKARRGRVIAVCAQGDNEVRGIADDVIEVPRVHETFNPFLMVVPLQLLAYYAALELGRDVDQPRNLAKSVTVE